VDELVNDLGNDNYPIIGLSISGGGTQSGFGGLGIWQAFDDRYPPAVQAGTGGLTQLLSYISGLSGGGCVAVSTMSVFPASSSRYPALTWPNAARQTTSRALKK
jgi:lysophospholipase